MQQVVKQQQNYTYTCAECGDTYTTHRKARGANNVCGNDCHATMLKREGAAYARSLQDAKSRELCIRYEHDSISILNDARQALIDAQRQAKAKASRSPLRVAIEDNDKAALIALIPKITTESNGCRVRTTGVRNGYPTVKWSNVGLHRLVLEVIQDAPLGTQAAHHKCGNSACINPDHLQPVTFAENTAEMLARHAYVNRIRELEDALREVDPEHELLNRAAYELAL